MKKLLVVSLVALVLMGSVVSATGCDETLVDKLSELLKGLTPSQIDDAVAQTKDALIRKAEQAKKQNLEELFDAQIATLKDRGTPEQIVEILQNQKSAVLEKASGMTYGDGSFDTAQDENIPFLPVIPRTFRSPYDLMAMVQNGGKVGYTYLNPTQISDVVDTSPKPYYIYDVENGSSTRSGKSPENAEKILKQQKRSPLTVAEVMALITHTDVLSKHYVWALGSRYGSGSDRVPGVYLDLGDRPGFIWGYVYVYYADDRWGSASCGSR